MSKTVLVTGASSGLGKAIAQAFRQNGYSVFGTSRNPHNSTEGVQMLAMDLEDNASIQAAIGYIDRTNGQLDILVNNAGIGIAGPLEESSLQDVQKVFNTNVIGTVGVCQAALPLMRRQGHGKIFNISSIGARVGLPYRGIYCATKSSIDLITEALRIEVQPFGIQACCIHAGDLKTNINANRLKSYRKGGPYAASFERVYRSIDEEVDRGLPAEVVARKILLLAKQHHLRPYYAVGKPLQRFSLLLKKVLPATWFEMLIARYAKA
jgi:NAD(P)-dependent dehydrogenase (short-subunit alcohol dehydrogenase family)